MTLDLSQHILAGVIIFLAGIVQSAVGFGYALFSTPLLVWIGIPLHVVITVVATCALIQGGIGVRQLRATAPWRLSVIAAGVRMPSMIIGVFVLKRIVDLRADQIRIIVGCMLCLLVAVQFFWKPRPVEKTHWSWAGLSFVASGLLAGICGMGGPPLVLWSMAHTWSSEKTRGFLFAVYVASIPIQIILLYFAFGSNILSSVMLAIIFSPFVYLGTLVGMPIGNRMSKDKLRGIAYAILMTLGISAAAPAALAYFR